MQDHNKPAANPLIVLREEFEDSAILYNPDSGSTFGLNPLGVFIWKRLDGHHSEEDDLLRHQMVTLRQSIFRKRNQSRPDRLI